MKKSYLERLSLLAHWYLPPAEADDVIADYQELMSQNPRSDEEMIQEVGSPLDAVLQVKQRRGYLQWRIVFCLLFVCLLFPVVNVFYPLLSAYRDRRILATLLFTVGIGTSLIWFSQTDRRKAGPLPRGLKIGLLIQILLVCAIFAAMYWFTFSLFPRYWPGETWFQSFLGQHILPGEVVVGCFGLVGAASAGMGLLGLIWARLFDPRWGALYILALTSVILFLFAVSRLRSMTLPPQPLEEFIWQFSRLAITGLIATGISLC